MSVALWIDGGPQNGDPLSLNSTDVQQLNENLMPYLELAYFFQGKRDEITGKLNGAGVMATKIS